MKSVAWKFLTNHALVLICVTRNEAMRLRDIADAVGITERATHAILADLVEGGYVIREKAGRRNVYAVVAEGPLRHPLVDHHQVGGLLKMLGNPVDDPSLV